MKFGLVWIVLLLLISAFAGWPAGPRERLSEYGFFTGNLADLHPAENVIPYELNSPLFSNYAEKLRFIQLPSGGTMSYSDSGVFDFPVGTTLIKNFYYPFDFRKPEKGRRILETRLLVREESGWVALPYIWNEAQTEATYDPAGETLSISYVNRQGKKVSTPYLVPNKNQCKGCHVSGQALLPIGPSARQLNHKAAGSKESQLEQWHVRGLLTGLPTEAASIPRLSNYELNESGTLDQRARSYLDSNCGHCHSRHGPASTSGLFLDIFETDPTHLGIRKAPVAAGRGSGNFEYDIVPGQPQNSILVYRMKATDPGIAMPEIGREQVHAEGLALIEDWIRKMPTH